MNKPMNAYTRKFALPMLGVIAALAAVPVGSTIAQERGAAQLEQADMPIPAEDDYWSFILTQKGTDPASGETYDEYVLDYDLSWDDCLDLMHGSDHRRVACERQPAGRIG